MKRVLFVGIVALLIIFTSSYILVKFNLNWVQSFLVYLIDFILAFMASLYSERFE